MACNVHSTAGARVCVIRPSVAGYSETFISDHIEKLGAYTFLCGWNTPKGESLLSGDPPHRLFRAARRFYRLSRYYFETARWRRFLRQHRVDVVLAEYGPTAVAAMEGCGAAGVPLVAHFHGFDAYSHPVLEKHASAYQQLFRVAAAIVVVSRDMGQQLAGMGAPREKIFYNPCGVDPSRFTCGDPATADPRFVMVGRFVDKKAPHLAIVAFAEALKVFPDAKLVAIGDGPLWEACLQLARGLGIAHAVEFLGSRPHTEVAAIMRNARAFLQHSVKTTHGDSEGTPVAILEAGMSGLPVVATRHGGIKDVVIDGITGFLVDEGDVRGMARHIIDLASNRQLAAEIGARARKHVLEHFAVEKTITMLRSVLQRAIHREVGPEQSVLQANCVRKVAQ